MIKLMSVSYVNKLFQIYNIKKATPKNHARNQNKLNMHIERMHKPLP